MALKKYADYRGEIAKEEWNDAWDLVNTNVVSKTANYTADIDDGIILCTGTFTVTLPTAVGISGKIYHVKNVSTGLITLEGDSTETIDGDLNQPVAQYENLMVASDGTNWSVI